MSAGPIPFTAIDAYARRFGVYGEDFAHLVRMVRAMDETLRAQGDAPAAPAKGSGRPMSPDLFDAVFG